MLTVRDLLDKKGSHVITISPDASVLSAAQRMTKHGIGGLIVTEGDRVVGVCTERDVLREVAAQRDPGSTPVEEIMTRKLMICHLETTLNETATIFKERRIRHLPVIEGDRLVGVISIGDINAWRMQSQESALHHLEAYLYSNPL